MAWRSPPQPASGARASLGIRFVFYSGARSAFFGEDVLFCNQWRGGVSLLSTGIESFLLGVRSARFGVDVLCATGVVAFVPR